jgi:hypothetical protein
MLSGDVSTATVTVSGGKAANSEEYTVRVYTGDVLP